MSIATFWKKLSDNWPIIYKLIEKQSSYVLKFINVDLLGELNKSVSIHLTFGQLNKQDLDVAEGLVIMYISANFDKNNINVVEQMYQKRIILPNLLLAKYAPFHERSEITINEITYDSFKVHCEYGFNEEKNPVLNLIVTAPMEYLEKKTIVFKKEPIKESKKESEESSRPVYFCKTDILNQCLAETIGEYNLIYFVSYIEILPQEEASKEVDYDTLYSINDHLKLIMKNYKHTSCEYCEVSSIQMNLTQCKCKKHSYCSKICQESSMHKC